MIKQLFNKREIASLVVAGSLLLLSGCAGYTHFVTMPSDSIQSVKPVETPRKKIDYSRLTWQDAIKQVKTPEQAQNYLDKNFKYVEDLPKTFAANYEDKKGSCVNYAIVAAALLSDNGYSSNLLALKGKNSLPHTVFLYKTQSSFGAIGNTPASPVYPTIDSLVHSINNDYNLDYDEYAIIDLNKTFPDNSWINGTSNLKTKAYISPTFTRIN